MTVASLNFDQWFRSHTKPEEEYRTRGKKNLHIMEKEGKVKLKTKSRFP